MKFSSKDFFSKCDQIRIFLRICVTFTKEILNGKLHFSGSVFRQVAILKSINRILENFKKMENILKFVFFIKILCQSQEFSPILNNSPQLVQHLSFQKKYFIFTLITAQKMKFSIKNFFSKCDQVRRKLRIWSHLLKKSLMDNFIFCAVYLHSNNNLKTIQQQQFHFRIYCFYYYYQNITSILYIFSLLRLPCYSPPEGLFPSFIYQRDKKLTS